MMGGVVAPELSWSKASRGLCPFHGAPHWKKRRAVISSEAAGDSMVRSRVVGRVEKGCGTGRAVVSASAPVSLPRPETRPKQYSACPHRRARARRTPPQNCGGVAHSQGRLVWVVRDCLRCCRLSLQPRQRWRGFVAPALPTISAPAPPFPSMLAHVFSPVGTGLPLHGSTALPACSASLIVCTQRGRRRGRGRTLGHGLAGHRVLPRQRSGLPIGAAEAFRTARSAVGSA
jgi:hypothetical protein